MTAQKPTLLVTGASGQLGRQVIDLLLQAEAGPVIAMTRNPEKIAALKDRGVEIRQGDFDDPASLATAFAGADRVLIVSTDGVGRPGGRQAQHVAAVKAAAAAGVSHVVYTSAPAPTPTSHDSVINDHYWTEVALAESKLPGWTVLRNHIYADMILRALPPAIASGQLFSATGQGGRSYVTRADCAGAAAGALAADFYDKRILDVTGPAPVTQDEIAAIAGELTGKTVRHIPLSGDDLRKGLLAAGIPPAYAEALSDFDVAAAQGYHAIVTPAVKELSGKEPTGVRAFLTANRQAFMPAV
ncbi:MAG: NAD(P)H-binding protein [Bauldia sp.]